MDLGTLVKVAFEVVIGDEKRVEVFLGTQEEEAATRALARGKADQYLREGRKVVWSDGREEWINHEAAFDQTTKDFVWNEDGDRVLVNRVKNTRASACAEIEKKTLKSTWRNAEKFLGE